VKIIDARRQFGECGFNASDAGAFDFYGSTETLIRIRLLEPRDVSEQLIDGRGQYGAYIVTTLGWAFLRAVMRRDEYRDRQRQHATSTYQSGGLYGASHSESLHTLL
jgi:hypothetical protein